MNKIKNYFKNNFNLEYFNLNNSVYLEDIKNYYQNAQADAIHCFTSIEKYLDKDKKILEVGGAFICLPVFYIKIMILLPLNLVVLQALPMNCVIKF